MKGYFVYCLCAENCDAVYIGSTINLTDRVKSHIYHNKVFSKVFYLVCESEEQMLLLEKQFISKFKPTYNKIMYSVDPFDGEVYWSELDKSEFTYYLQQREYGYTQRVCPVLERANSAILYYCVDKNIMKLRHLYSKICIDNNTKTI